MKFIRTLIGLAVLGVTVAPALAQNVQTDAERVATATNNEWLSINGTVRAVFGETFFLDYGGGAITVEMDNYDWYNENVLLVGDRISVTGRLDSDLFEARTIEASSVYVEKLNEYFYANAADEEGGFYAFPTYNLVRDGEWIGVTGTVISWAADSLIVDTGFEHLKVDLEHIDRELNLDTGDRVSVYGEIDNADFLESRELQATSVIRLSQG